MDLWVLDNNLNRVKVFDDYSSLIWTDRYSAYGDFEITKKMDKDVLNYLKPNYYLVRNDSDYVMVIEDIQIKTDVLDGDVVYVTGRSLESILTWRIVWDQTVITENLQNGIKKLIDENIISPKIVNRRLDNFIFEMSPDPLIESLTVDSQFTGDNLYDAIKGLCDINEIGFRITLTDDLKFKFKLYSGRDRSYNQFENPYVVFSSEFDNLISSEYLNTTSSFKNVALVAGEGEGVDRKTTIIESDSSNTSGIYRKEIYVDAKEISSNIDGGTIADTEYTKLLAEKGNKTLSENGIVTVFEGDIDHLNDFVYNKDYYIGDIIQLKNKYGIEDRSRVTEIIFSQDNSGISLYPTFISLNKDDSND